MKYQVVRKANGKFAPRLVGPYGSLWFKDPVEFDNFKDALDAMRIEQEARAKAAEARLEQLIYEEIHTY